MAPQVVDFFSRELKHEIRRKSLEVSFDSAVENLGLDSVQSCQMAIEDYLFAANQINRPFDFFNGNKVSLASNLYSLGLFTIKLF